MDSLIPQEVRRESIAFFLNDILANGWVRALSLKDPVMENVYSLEPSIEDKLAMRADWTGYVCATLCVVYICMYRILCIYLNML